MPVVIALLIRSIVQITVTLGIDFIATKFILPHLNTGIAKVMEVFGVDEETAKDIMANEILIFIERVGISALTLRAKLPTKIAEKLGFTSKGWLKRPLASTTKAKVEAAAKIGTPTAAATQAEAVALAELVSKSQSLPLRNVQNFLTLALKIAAFPVGFFYAFAQYVDYGAWENPYQGTAEKLLSKIGIRPDTVLPKAGTISSDSWKQIYSTIEELNPVGLAFPFSGKTTLYSRKDLVDLVDEIVANMRLMGGNPTVRNVMAAMLPLVQFGGNKPGATGSSAGISLALAGGTTLPTVRVFTGILSQGVLGQGLSFTPRPDDIIESVEEFKQAAANNLAPFLAALPSKVIYEVKSVAQITTKDGFTQRGTTQKILIGKYSNGNPKYKTVTNKFGVLYLYILSDKGTRTKISTIVLGPVDSAKLQVTQDDLRSLELALPGLVTTNKISEVSQVVNPQTGQSTSVQSTAIVLEASTGAKLGIKFYYGNEYPGTSTIPVKSLFAVFDGINRKIIDPENLKLAGLDPSAVINVGERTEQNLRNAGVFTEIGGTNIRISALLLEAQQRAEWIEARNKIDRGEMVGSPAPKAGAGASTLLEWYQQNGKSLPSVSERAKIYEEMGLGQSSYYAGTVEQNTKLLSALKA